MTCKTGITSQGIYVFAWKSMSRIHMEIKGTYVM